MLTASDDPRWRSRYYSTGGARRRFLDAGSGPRALLCLHGIPSHHVIWREVIAALPPTIRAIAPDLTGFGCSEFPPDAGLSPDDQARDMLAMLDRLGVARFGVVAHDYGALVACALLDSAPGRVTCLALTNTSLLPGDWSGSWLSPLQFVRLPGVGELAFRLARPFMLRWAYSIYVLERRKLDGPLMNELWAPFEHGFERTLLRLFRERGAGPDDFRRWRAALSRYDGPALIAWGARDPTFTAQRAVDIAGLLPQAEKAVLPGASHFVQIDRPRALAHLLGRLVERVE